jgi:uncharacterized cupredoxin-like copper-binding protein
MTRPIPMLAAIVAAVLVVAGCGSSGSSSGGAAPAKTTATAPAAPAGSSASSGADLKLAAVESNGLSFDRKTLAAKAGKVTIVLDNPSSGSLPHAIAVEGNGVDKDGQTVQPGSTSTVSLNLKPGKYTFYCPVPGHRQAGMKGILTVQ